MGNTVNVTLYFHISYNYTNGKKQQQFHLHKTSENEKMNKVNSADRWYKSTIIPDLEEENKAEETADYRNNY